MFRACSRRVRILGCDCRFGRLALRALHQLHQSELARHPHVDLCPADGGDRRRGYILGPLRRNRIPRHPGSACCRPRNCRDCSMAARCILILVLARDRDARTPPRVCWQGSRPARPPRHHRLQAQIRSRRRDHRARSRGIHMSFGGVKALRGGAVEVPAGSIVGLIGRNGSGKSTLFNCISGFCRPQAGKVTCRGTRITGLRPHRIVSHGIVRTFQTPRLDFEASVRTAVLCGFYPASQSSFLGALAGLPRASGRSAR